ARPGPTCPAHPAAVVTTPSRGSPRRNEFSGGLSGPPLAFATKTQQKSGHPLSKDRAMKAAVVVFPGLNRDRDMIAALTKIGGTAPAVVWHKDADIPDVDLIVIPGGFSYGDYLRCGAIAARSPVMDVIRERADKGVKVLG